MVNSMSLDALAHLLSVLSTPLPASMQSIVETGTIQVAALFAQRDKDNISAYWHFLELVMHVADFHLDVVLAANVPQIIFSTMAQHGVLVRAYHNVKTQQMSMRALSALVHDRNGPHTTIDFFDEQRGMVCVFNFVHMQPRCTHVDCIVIELLTELTVRYPETVVRMCSLSLILTINKIM